MRIEALMTANMRTTIIINDMTFNQYPVCRWMLIK